MLAKFYVVSHYYTFTLEMYYLLLVYSFVNKSFNAFIHAPVGDACNRSTSSVVISLDACRAALTPFYTTIPTLPVVQLYEDVLCPSVVNSTHVISLPNSTPFTQVLAAVLDGKFNEKAVVFYQTDTGEF